MAAKIKSEHITKTTECIGYGSYGSVYPGKLNVAIKELKFVKNDEMKKSFEAEVAHLLLAQHPNIIRLYGTSIRGDVYSIIMEYAENGSLDTVLFGDSKMEISFSHRQNLMYQCAKGMDFLHNMKPIILHRDLKPKNLLLTNNYGTLKICDFGTARELGTDMTKDVGTVKYRAPEINTNNPYTEKCDVYSFGITLWEVMSGKQAFGGIIYPFTIGKLMCDGNRPDLKEVQYCDNKELMKDLIKQSWDPSPNMRPSMKMLAMILGFNHNTESMQKLREPLDKDIQIDSSKT